MSLNNEYLILNTFRFCEKVRDLGFRPIRDIIFSGLVKYQWGAMKRLIWWKEPLEASPTLWSTLRRCLQVEFQSTKKFTSWENVQEKNFKDFFMPSIYETMPESRVSKKMIFYIPRKCRRNFLTTFFCQANASKQNSFISLVLLHFIANELFVRGCHEMTRTTIIWINNRNIHVL